MHRFGNAYISGKLSLPPICNLTMDELACLGCGKVYDSQRRLSAHETLCETHLTFTKQISKSYRRAERSRKIKKRKINHRESFSEDEDGDAILPDPPQDIGDMDVGDWHAQVCCHCLQSTTNM
jgi:hypothetical protein